MSSTAYGNRLSEKAISDALTDLALDLRWSFNHSADQLWARLDPDLWDLTHNPWVVLQTVSRERLQSVTADPNFQKLLRRSSARKDGRADRPTAGFKKHTRTPASPRWLISRWNSC